MKVIFGAGIVLLSGFLFIPLGYLNEEQLVLIPVFTEGLPDQQIWEWQNSAAFVLTYFVSTVLLIYFRIRRLKLGIVISLVINIVSVLLIFTIIWMMKTGLSYSDSFEYSFNWIFWLIGLILVVIAEIKKTGS